MRQLRILLTLLPLSATAHAIDGGYAVVVSRWTLADPAWQAVVDAAVAKYQATTIPWDGDVTEAEAPLAKLLPRYAAFVARPEEAGRAFVVAVHRLTRRLDPDPYTDVIWGILTGYEPGDCLRMLRAEPLTVGRGLGGTGIPLDTLDEGIWFDEGRKNHVVVKPRDGKAEDQAGPDDPAERIAELFNTYQPDLWMTSGHATERDWQIGYSYPAGQLRCKDGVLLAIPRDGLRVETTGDPPQRRAVVTRFVPIQSANPKVYLAVGNCLMGHVADRQAMAAAFLHSGGVDQMIGYTVVTWFGYMGWGINDYFLGQPGRYNLAQAFFANQQALLYRLNTEFAGKPQPDPTADEYQHEQIDQLAARLGYAQFDEAAKNHVGLLWDRDVVAFYGDPAWDARLAPRDPAYDEQVELAGGALSVTITGRREASFGRPPVVFLPRRVRPGEVREGAELKPVVGGWFVMLPGLTKVEPGKTWRVVVAVQ
ncbi:MAG: hypothetical protein HYU66_26080 [Armatimonadetes bacterium]|nr:hypothetical protein [Armatimonadota bacterium]